MSRKSSKLASSSAPGLLRRLGKRYFIDAMGGMGMGLFASLVVGLILKQMFSLLDLPALAPLAEAIMINTAPSSPVIGAVIGVAVAMGLKAKPFPMYSAGVAGAIGYSVVVGGVAAGPAAAFVASLVACEVGTFVSGKTPIDIIVVPAAAIISGGLAGLLVGPPIASLMLGLGATVNEATMLRPLLMGMIVASIVGGALSAPISSAALAIMLGLDGLAAGAATAGCAAHMVGFAVASYGENGIAGLLSQGLGTSKLQMGNIARRPLIIVPAAVAAIVGGALSATVFGMENIAIGAGMGTSGLVGPIAAWSVMSDKLPATTLLIYMALLFFIIPAIVAGGTARIMRNKGLIKQGDMKLEL